MSLTFGTDGVRGRAYDELTLDYVERLGRAAAAVLGGQRFYLGRDTRESGPDFEAALGAGLQAAGVQAISIGVIPTPGLAWLAAADGVAAAMISASHNPWFDNGIKLFAAGGNKLTDAVQDQIEAELTDARAETGRRRSTTVDGAANLARYTQAVIDSVGERRLGGLRLVIDCANGSNSYVAADVLRALGADVDVIGAKPDGRNINARCGSTHPELLQRLVVERRADAGIAFDGDADRLIAVDHTGALVDGDQIIAICARDRYTRRVLANNRVVVTVMSNLGFRLAMRDLGVEVIETPVGDRYVLEAIDATGAGLGGEQSGHIIFSDLATTGDGLLSAVQLLDVVSRRGAALADLAGEAMSRLPQVLRNVRIDSPRSADLVSRLAADVAAAEARLGERGRVLIRPSGTEPLIRVMVEAGAAELAAQVADELVAAVERAASLN